MVLGFKKPHNRVILSEAKDFYNPSKLEGKILRNNSYYVYIISGAK